MSTLRRPLASSCTPRAAPPPPSRGRQQGRKRRRVPLSGLGHAALLLVGLYLLGVAAQWLHGDDIDVSGKRHRRMQWGKPTSDPSSTDDAYFLPLWAHHVTTHPVHARDRSGFAEMGLRTRMYASLLEHPRLRNFDYFEQILWPFLPGIKTLRQTFVGARKRGRTRGIVMSLGSRDFEYAVHFLSTLRSVYHSSLPVEVYYYGDEDLAPNLRAYLTATFAHVRTVDLEQLGFFDADQVQLRGQGYALKTFALVATNLTDVILADADAVFLTPPDSLFDQPGYAATGTLFFHDRDHIREGASTTIRTFLEAQLGAREPSAQLRGSAFWQKRGIYEQESGVVVVDKSRPAVFSALLFTAWMNTGAVRDQTTYRVFWGDKETFWLAFELAELAYHFAPGYAGAIGTHTTIDGRDDFCSEHPLHMIAGPHPHQQRPSWFNGSLRTDKMHGLLDLIAPNVWATDGQWVFLEEGEAWCMRNYTARSKDEHGLAAQLATMTRTAAEAERMARRQVTLPPLRPLV